MHDSHGVDPDLQAPHGEEWGGGSTALRLLHGLRRHWILFGSIWTWAILLGAGYAMTIKPVYRPQATLEVRPEMPVLSAEHSDAAAAASLAMWANFYRTQETLLRSPRLVQEVIASLPEEERRDFQSPTDPVKAFLDKLDIEKAEASYILKVGFIHPDPELATSIVNSLVTRYLEDANRRLRALRGDTLEVLTTEALPVIRERYDEAEKAHQAFQKETGFADFEEQYGSLVEARRKTEERLLEIRLRAFRVQSDIDSLRAGGREGQAAFFTEVFHTSRVLDPLMTQRVTLAAEIARQREFLKEGHPRYRELVKALASVDEKVAELVQGAAQSMEADLAALRGEEGALVEEAARLEKAMGTSRRFLTEYQRLVAAKTTSQELYTAYLKKQDETRATSDSGQAGVRIVDLATVTREPHRKAGWILNVSIVAGLLLGLLVVRIAEHLDDRIRSAREVKIFVGLDLLGEIPEWADDGGALKILSERSEAAESEAFRSLRAHVTTRLEDAESAKGAKVVLVTSSEAGEGKTSVAVNLARVLAVPDRRVLLFDAELRRPALKSLLADARGLGLEEVLRGEATLAEAAQRSRVPGVDVIGADEGLLEAAGMAGSPRFRQAVEAASEAYDYVVIDSAPVNAVAESALIGRRADATLLVVRLGVTSRASVLAARRKLEDMKVKVLGAVVIGGPGSPAYHGYKNRRDPAREAERIAIAGDELVGIE